MRKYNTIVLLPSVLRFLTTDATSESVPLAATGRSSDLMSLASIAGGDHWVVSSRTGLVRFENIVAVAFWPNNAWKWY